MSGPRVGSPSFDPSGRTLEEGAPQDASGMVHALQASLGLPGELAGPHPAPSTAVACLELHSRPRSVVIEIEVLVALNGPPDWPFLEGSLRGDICTPPATTWRVVGGLGPEIPTYKRSRFVQTSQETSLYIWAERGPLEIDPAAAPAATAASGGCASAIYLQGSYLHPGLYSGVYFFPPINGLGDIKAHQTLFKGWQPC